MFWKARKFTQILITLFLLLNVFVVVNMFLSNEDHDTFSELDISKSEPNFKTETAEQEVQNDRSVSSMKLEKKETAQELPKEDLKRLVIQDEFCKVIDLKDQILSQLGSKIILEAYDLPNSNNNYSDALFDIFQYENPLEGNSNSYARTEASEFLNALLLSGQLKSKKSMDHAQALKIFENLETRNPENSAYTLFKARLLKDMGRSNDDVKSEILRAVAKKNFNTHIALLKKNILERGFTNASFFVLAQNINDSIQLLSLSHIKSMILEFVTQKEVENSFLHSIMGFAINMMNLPNYNQDFRGLNSLTIKEFNLGRSIYLSAWKQLYPNWNPPTVKSAAMYASNSFYSEAYLINKEIKKIKEKKNCERDTIDSLIQSEKQNYQQRKSPLTVW